MESRAECKEENMTRWKNQSDSAAEKGLGNEDKMPELCRKPQSIRGHGRKGPRTCLTTDSTHPFIPQFIL